MKFTWINHASYLTEAGNVKLICDPWLDGRVFNESWAHISPTLFSYEEFKNVTHIWFSHEHPDHFFPPNIDKIKPEQRANITVIYQETIDQKVKNYCSKMGFKKIIEMKPFKPYKLSDEVTVINAKVKNESDSWLIFKYKERTFVNLNDCVFYKENELIPIKKVAGEIDVLFTQFSYANWSGNPEEPEKRKKAANEKLESTKMFVNILKPKYVVPFASYVWFAHRDNFFMNDHPNSIEYFYNFIKKELKIKPIVLYNGERWEIGEDHNSIKSIEKYKEDIKRIFENPQLTIPKIISEPDLVNISKIYITRALNLNNKNKLVSYKPLSIFVFDLKKSYELSFKNGLILSSKEEINCDIRMASQSFKYCMEHLWGFSSIVVAGTFSAPKGGDFQNFLEYQWISDLNNLGKHLGSLFERGINRVFNFFKALLE